MTNEKVAGPPRPPRRLYLLSTLEHEGGPVHTPDEGPVRAVAERLYGAMVATRSPEAPTANDEEYLNGVLTATLWELEDLAVDMTGRLGQAGHPTPVCLEAVIVLLATAREHARISLDGLISAFQGARAALVEGAGEGTEASPPPKRPRGPQDSPRRPGRSIAV